MNKTLYCLLLAILVSSYGYADDRPNIIFLMADDQCTYSMGCYGTPGAKTPNLDRLAREGMIFDCHYTTTAICMASRANVVTGMYEYKTGCNFQHGPLLASHWKQSYPVLLRNAGYRTAFAGKIGFEVAAGPGEKGRLPSNDFDAWGAGPGQTSYQTSENESMAKYAKEFPHSTLSYGAFGRDFIRASTKFKSPFCLSISFKAPHKPATPDPRFDGIYTNVKLTRPLNYGRENGAHFSKQSRQGRQYDRFHSWNYSDKYSEVMATYYQQIYAIDAAVGMLRETLDECGAADNTVIIYTSDNGFLCGSHGYGSKVLPYEESSRVPLIIYDPRHENSGKQLRCASLTGNIDFAPTILSLAGLKIRSHMDGADLTKLYAQPTESIHEYLTLINVWGPTPTHSLAVVTNDWKYINWPYEEDGFERFEEMYDLRNDRLELTNLVGKTSAENELVQMQKLYDKAVAHWKANAVPYHKYKRFGSWFERK